MAVSEEPSVISVIGRIVDRARGRLDFALRPGVDPRALAEAEATIGFALPDDVRQFYLAHVSEARDLDEFNSLAPGTFVAVPYDLWNAVKRDSSPFVWDYFTESPRNAEDRQLLDKLRATR